jgi:hypothetical protein
MDNEKISHRIKENLYPFHLAQLLFLDLSPVNSMGRTRKREKLATNLHQQVHPKQEAQ